MSFPPSFDTLMSILSYLVENIRKMHRPGEVNAPFLEVIRAITISLANSIVNFAISSTTIPIYAVTGTYPNTRGSI